jgi:hypothetical protein
MLLREFLDVHPIHAFVDALNHVANPLIASAFNYVVNHVNLLALQ